MITSLSRDILKHLILPRVSANRYDRRILRGVCQVFRRHIPLEKLDISSVQNHYYHQMQDYSLDYLKHVTEVYDLDVTRREWPIHKAISWKRWDILAWLIFDYNFQPNSSEFSNIIDTGDISLIKLALTNGLDKRNERDENLYYYQQAIKFGSIEILMLLFENSQKRYDRVIDMAASCGDLKIVKWLFKRDDINVTFNTFACGVSSGNFELIKWMHKKKFPWTTEACTRAARKGYLDILKWLHERECPWGREVCSTAINNNHNHIVTWLRSLPKCPCECIYHT